ncbi:MAG: hypothetical protein E7267_02175 [Lachnospiraceae bacterium]|nr:hypothetical protein [Lachnospiraceae bacterium]
MRLIECHIENFGILSDITISFEDGLNVFARDNGWGKSTLAEFIKVMFFGFDNESKRDSYENKRKRYAPWQGGIYGGSLTFETGAGVSYTIYRQFGSRAKEDTFELRYHDTGMMSYDFSEKIGEELFHINSESFAKTVFISQNDCETKATGEVISKMSDSENAVYDIDNYETAAKNISDCLNRMSPDRKTGMLYKLKDELVSMKVKLGVKDSIEAELARLNSERNDNHARIRELAEKKSRLYENHNLSSLINEYNILRNDVLERKKLLKEEVEPDNKTPHRKSAATSVFVVSFMVTVFLILAYAVTVMKFLGLIIAAGFFALIGVVGMIASVYSNRAQAKSKFEREKIIREQRQAEYERSMQRIDEFENKHSDIIDKLVAASSDDGFLLDAGNELMTADYEEKQLINDNNTKETRISELKKELELIEELYISFCEKEEEYTKLKKEYELICFADKFLKKAKDSFSAQYILPVKEIYRKYYSRITGENADHHYLDADTNLAVHDNGLQRDKQYYSRGLRDLMGICMRLALVDVMFEIEHPFIIMDDAFINLDEKKRSGAYELITDISKEHQIIYFTCSKSV